MSHLAFIFPQFQDHPTKTERGAWFIVRRKDKCSQLWIGRQMIKGRNSNVLSSDGFINFSGGQAHDARGGTDGTKWSEVRRNIFSKTNSSRRNISQKKTFYSHIVGLVRFDVSFFDNILLNRLHLNTFIFTPQKPKLSMGDDFIHSIGVIGLLNPTINEGLE